MFPMTKSQIAVRVPSSLLQKLNRFVEQSGLSKTEIVTGALANYLDSQEHLSFNQRLTEIEKRLTFLENPTNK